MQFQNMNIDALQSATDFFVGTEGTAMHAKLYHVIDAAQRAAYEQGKADAEANVEERLDNAFDEGFEQGASFQQLEDEADTQQAVEECYDDGYLDGVADARACGAIADAEVQDIINRRADAAFEALDEQLYDEV